MSHGPVHPPTKQQVVERDAIIWRRHGEGLASGIIAKRLGVTRQLVQEVVRRESRRRDAKRDV